MAPLFGAPLKLRVAIGNCNWWKGTNVQRAISYKDEQYETTDIHVTHNIRVVAVYR